MNCTEEENAMEATPVCQAWLRPDGGKGIRNKVLVLYTVECSKHVAESIAAHFQAQHRDVDVTGSLACLDNQAVVQRMLAYCVHPNVGAVLIVGHGCEYIEPDRIRDFARAHGRPAEAFYLQKVGGTEAGIALGCRLVGEMLEKIEAGPRAPMYAHELIIGAKCGGSDFTSGIAGNAVIGKFFENLTAAGGTAMMEEIAEAVGLRGHLVSRAVNEDVARDVGLTYDKTMEFCRRLGRYSISPGNFVGGLTTIEEKSMGAVVKMGGCRIEGVLKIAQRPKHPGFWLLDVIPDDKPEPAFFFGGDATGLLDQIGLRLPPRSVQYGPRPRRRHARRAHPEADRQSGDVRHAQPRHRLLRGQRPDRRGDEGRGRRAPVGSHPAHLQWRTGPRRARRPPPGYPVLQLSGPPPRRPMPVLIRLSPSR